MNKYLIELENHLQGKYKKYIINLISNRLNNTPKDTYTESHHIVPRSWGGINNKKNLVILTAREHFLVHAMLPKASVGEKKSKIIYAFMKLCFAKTKNQNRYNSKIYTYKRGSLKTSEETKKRISESVLSNVEEIKRRKESMIDFNKKII